MADFSDIKEKVSIEQAAQFLGLQLKKEPTSLRCTCPVHGGDARSLAITPARNIFYCMSAKQGGSCLDLVAHVRQVSLPEAANLLAQHFRIEAPKSKPVPAATGTGPKEIDYLDPLHEAVEALGLSPATADIVGIGWADKGWFRGGKVGVPVRTKDGALLGYFRVGSGADVQFHASVEEQANIIAFKKPA